MILTGKERLEHKGNDSRVTAMLIAIILYPPLVLEDERTTLDVMDTGAGECSFIGIWSGKGFEELSQVPHESHRNTLHPMFGASFVLFCP